ncbi:hypothetical protein [Streptomyces griseosporeus]|uniref:hypothetical protein n=1 Tax=Streptomyces griseosporeus TaxID=1910 RepID=UPI0036F66B10
MDSHFSPVFPFHWKAATMSNFSDWQDRMLRAVWRHGEHLPEEVLTWMHELYDERGEIPEPEFCDLWTDRTFSMARSAFETVTSSAEQATGKPATGDDFSYIDYTRDPALGPVGVVHIKSSEVSTPDPAEVLAAVAEGVQEFIMTHHQVPWPVCDEHDRGLHVAYFHETVVWKCTGGPGDGHVVRAIAPAVQP